MRIESLLNKDAIDLVEVIDRKNVWDLQVEDQMKDFLSSPTFGNQVFTYSYEHNPYTFRVVHNPERLTLKVGFMTIGSPFIFATRGDLPKELVEHLTDLIKEKLNVKGGFISQGTINGAYAFDLLERLNPT